MALHIETLKTRSLTAVVFVAVMLCGLFINYWSFFLLFTVIHFGCWKEYQKLMGLIDEDYNNISLFHQFAVMLGGWGLMLWNVDTSQYIINLNLSEIGKWIVIAIAVLLPLKELILSKRNNIKVLGFSFLGLVYISLAWALMIDIRNWASTIQFANGTVHTSGEVLPIILIASIWINDTMAYIVGSLIGKTPLTKISPKKTWEGTAGGAILCIVVVALLSHLFINKLPLHIAIAIPAIAATFGTIGDIVESKLKRMTI